MKSAVDNKPPQQFSHIGGNNSKKLSADKGTTGAVSCCAARARARESELRWPRLPERKHANPDGRVDSPNCCTRSPAS